jgi:hypothetical protein
VNAARVVVLPLLQAWSFDDALAIAEQVDV